MALYQTRSGRRFGLLTAAGAAYNAYNNASPQTRAFVDSIPSRVRTGVRQGIDRFRSFNRARSRYSSRRVSGGNFASSFRSGPNVGGRRRRSSRGKLRTFRKGNRRGRRGRPRRSRRGKTQSRLLGHMFKRLCTPMGYHATVAHAYSGVANLRSNVFEMLGGEIILRTLGAKHPANFLFDTVQGTASPAVLSNFGGDNWQLSIDKFVHDLRIQNRSNASMELKIYECVIRHDVANSAIATSAGPAGIVSAMFDGNLLPTFAGAALNAVGPNQAALPTGMTSQSQHPAFTPYQSEAFVSTFKILKTHSMKLAPNEIISRKFALKPKLFKAQWLLSNGANEWISRWSKTLMFSWVGMPVDDGTLSNQGKAKCDLFLQNTVHVNYHFLPGTTQLQNFSYTDDYNTSGQKYNFNPAGFTHVIPASDTIETVAAPADTVAEVAP